MLSCHCGSFCLLKHTLLSLTNSREYGDSALLSLSYCSLMRGAVSALLRFISRLGPQDQASWQREPQEADLHFPVTLRRELAALILFPSLFTVTSLTVT